MNLIVYWLHLEFKYIHGTVCIKLSQWLFNESNLSTLKYSQHPALQATVMINNYTIISNFIVPYVILKWLLSWHILIAVHRVAIAMNYWLQYSTYSRTTIFVDFMIFCFTQKLFHCNITIVTVLAKTRLVRTKTEFNFITTVYIHTQYLSIPPQYIKC